jgi:hypothetical protein
MMNMKPSGGPHTGRGFPNSEKSHIPHVFLTLEGDIQGFFNIGKLLMKAAAGLTLL